MAGLVPAETLKDYIGTEFEPSDWLEVDQDRINQFADATLDYQFIHVDSEKATPLFGATIAHGFLSAQGNMPSWNSVTCSPSFSFIASLPSRSMRLI